MNSRELYSIKEARELLGGVWSSQDFVDTLKRRAEQVGGWPSVQAIHPVGYTTDIRVYQGSSPGARGEGDVQRHLLGTSQDG
jgi:hypothetical protein